MASYYMLRPAYTSHLLYPSPSSQDRISQDRIFCLGLRRRNARHLSSLRCMRDWGLWADFSSPWGKLAASSTSSTVVVVAYGNYPGRVDTAVDAGAKVSDPQFFPNILDTQSRSKESTAPPSLPDSNGSASNGPGPSDFDFEIYASNSMEGFEPPPPPRIPFGGPFEDYYGEIVGDDYIPKQEKPTSSLLMFLDSLNAKRAEEEANAEKNPKKPLFSQSRPVPSARENRPLFPDNRSLFPQSRPVEQPATTQPTAEEKPLLPQTRPVQGDSGDTSSSSPLLPQSSNVQGTTDASSRPIIPQNRPVDITPSFPQSRPSEVSMEQSVLSRQTRSVEESKEQKPPFSSPTSTVEQTSSSGRPLFPQTRTMEDSRDSLSPTTRTTDEIRDSGGPLSPQTRMVEQERGSSMPFSPQTRSLEEIKDSSRPFSTLTRVTEELRDSNRPLSPQSRTTEETMGSRPLSPSTRSFDDTRDTSRSLFPQTRSAEEVKDNSRSFSPQTRHEKELRESSQPLIPQNRPMDETRDSSWPSFPQSRPAEEIRDSRRPFEDFRDVRSSVSQSRPLEETRDVRPLIPQTRRVEETRPLVPQTRSVEETKDSNQSISSQARSSEETSGSSRSLFPQTRPLEATSDSRTSFSQTRPVEETLDSSRPLFSQSRSLEEIRDSSRPPFSQSRPVDVNRDDDRPLSPQIRPAEGITDNKPLFSGNGETIPQNAWTSETSASLVDQVNGVMAAKPGSPTLSSPATAMNALGGFAEAVLKSQFYEPREGDNVLAAVTFADDQELDLEIGAELPALMSLRDFQPFPTVDNIFFKLPPTDGSSQTLEGFVAPHGESLLVEDKAANDGSYRDETVHIGTIVIAEVQGRAVTDGRAILSSRLPAQRLAWHRIEQLMRLGEAIQLEIVQWNEGGLLGYLEGVRSFLPRSELLQRPESTAVLKDYVGRTLPVAIVQADKQASNIIISEVKPWMSKNLQLGTVHDVTVTRVYPYGMQVEVDNTRIRGFVHISNFSKEFVSSVTSIFAEGDKARVMLIRGRNPGQVSFSIADLESDRGLILRDKEQVFQDAEEMAKSFREGLSEQERQIFGLAVSETSLDFQDLGISNLNWLHVGNVINSS